MHTFIERGTRIATEIGEDDHPEVVRWTTWGDGPDIQQSFALISSEGTVFIDPIKPKGQEAIATLKQYCRGRPTGIICTTANHERNIYWFRERYGVPIYAPKDEASKFDGRLDHLYENGDILPGAVKAVRSDNTVQMILYWQAPGGKRILISGDAIYGQSSPGGFEGAVAEFWMQVGGIRLRREGIVDKDEMKRSFERLLDLEFDVILNGHNPKPLDHAPKEALREVLERGTLDARSGGYTHLWLDLQICF